MDCIEISYDQGYIDILNASDPARCEDWDDVRFVLTDVERIQNMIGWGRWTGLYAGTDELGGRRYYAVDEAS